MSVSHDQWPELIDINLRGDDGVLMATALLRHPHEDVYTLGLSAEAQTGLFSDRPMTRHARRDTYDLLTTMVADKVNPFVEDHACTADVWDFLSGGLVHEMADLATMVNDLHVSHRPLPVTEVSIGGALPERRCCTAMLQSREGCFVPVMPVLLTAIPSAEGYTARELPRYRL